MMPYLKIFGAEVIYMLAVNIVAGAAVMLQTVGKQYVGEHSSFIFSGDTYQCNAFFYLLGLILFVGAVLIGRKGFLVSKVQGVRQMGVIPKIVFAVIAALFSGAMFVVIAFCLFLMIGLSCNIEPEWTMYITCFGWPIFSLIIMIITEVLILKKHEE